MNSTNIILFCLLFWMIWEQRREKEVVTRKRIYKRKQEGTKMEALAKQFIGKNCRITFFGGNVVSGILLDVQDHALAIEKKKTKEIVNLEYVVSLEEIPAKK